MRNKKEIKEVSYTNYEEFQIENRKKINLRLNTVLWFSALTGPAIAFGVLIGIFPQVNYITCVGISVYMLILAGVHLFMVKKWPESTVNSFLALLALDVLLVGMSYNHVYINITWFLVPLLSLLFVDKSVYVFSLISNYILMVVSTWLISPYGDQLRLDYDVPMQYFANYIGGYTIETVIMLFAGSYLGKTGAGYFKELINKYKEIKDREEKLKEQVDILESMAGIYSNVNLLDFDKMTEVSLRSSGFKQTPMDLSKQTHTVMNNRIMESVVTDQLKDFKEFTNITTLQKRLTNKKSIYGEFISIVTGWFRAQYITVDTDRNGVPNKVIYTIQNIDNEKRKEEQLIRISLTDELTRLYNRRCYEEDCEKIRQKKMDEDFVLLSIDVNGLKITNDTKGHAAGDELIKASADCILSSIGAIGKAYRVGGDEFLAIIHSDDPEKIVNEIREKTLNRKGKYVDSVSLSIGYARHIDNKELSVDELEKIADANMYKEKEKYYEKQGLPRRIY
ncbi:MAG: GGDEF domain-containing protein [Lachnospiraceae bacterium]|nr:GGDEF domain-containing protein [Lachnospiraceae bacterium]